MGFTAGTPTPSIASRGSVSRTPSTPKLRRLKSEACSELPTISQRLVEYFVVVSSKPQWLNEASTAKQQKQQTLPKGNIHLPQNCQDYTFSPKITARYPLIDYPDNPLNPMVTHFCFPQSDSIVPSKEFVMSRIHHFVLTNDKGKKIYGTCLTVYEEYFPAGLNNPYNRRHKVHEMFPEKIEVTIDHDGNEEIPPLYIPRVLCILSTWPYLYAFREYLAQLYRLSTSTTLMEVPLERFVQNICLEIPAPPPGAFEIELSILKSQIKFWAPPAKMPIPYVSIPYSTLFECLDLDSVMIVWYALLNEQKVLLVSSQYSILTMCAETLLSLLFPLQWSHLYIPLLPRFLSPMLDAPIPYLVGVIRENWVIAEKNLSAETIVVDLDSNDVVFGSNAPKLVSPPVKKWTKLKATLQESVGDTFWRIRGLERESYLFKKGRILDHHIQRIYEEKGGAEWKERLYGYDDAFSMAYTPDSPNLKIDESSNGEQQSSWEQVQEAFLRFFVSTFRDYRKFLHVPDSAHSEDETNSDCHTFFNKDMRSFDRDGFVAWQKGENQDFFQEITMTQQFDDFITKRLYSPGEPDVIFFDQSIDSKLNRSKLRMKKVDTPFLLNAKAHKVLKTVLAVAPNTDGIEPGKTYRYESWPDEFDPNLFGVPRPIPKMITAEFDRQSGLVARLRSTLANEQVNLFGGDYDSSPEVATFTIFFFTYGALVGLDLEEFEERQYSQETYFESKELGYGPIEEKLSEEGDKSNLMTVTTAGESYDTSKETVSNEQCFPSGMILNVPDCINGSCTFNAFQYCTESICNYVQKVEMPDELTSLCGPKVVNNTRPLMEKSFVDTDERNIAKYEEIKAIAAAQLNLAFEALQTMSLRCLPTDPDAFKSLMEACGRCGNTDRAIQLIKIMKRDGFVADREIYSCFLKAFETKPADYEEECRHSLTSQRTNDAYCSFLEKKFKETKKANKLIDTNEDDDSEHFSDSSCSETSLKVNSSIVSEIMNTVFTPIEKRRKKKRRKRRSFEAAKRAGLPVTRRILKQVQLGESLLSFLYPDLSLDTGSNACPQCSTMLTEDDIVSGWKSCEFQDYTTGCPQCDHHFVPQFSVRCSSPDFVGSQGKGTPLYCEFLSPWVLRKELEYIIHGSDGVTGMLNPQWRQGTDIQATIWWNLIVGFKRFRLPLSFLLQGSFQNSLINPTPDCKM